MEAAVLDNVYNALGELPECGDSQGKLNSIGKVINLFTNKESIENSKKTLKRITDDIDKLPKEIDEIDLEKHSALLKKVNNSLTNVNSFLDKIKELFGVEEIIVNLDDKSEDTSVYTFLANAQKTQKLLSYLSDYLSLAIKIKKNSDEPIKSYSYQELVDFIAA